MPTMATLTADVTAGHLDSVIRDVTGTTGGISSGGALVSYTTGLDTAQKIVDYLTEQGEDAWIDRVFAG